MPRLADIEPAELSLVHRGAIRRPFNVRKAAETLPAETLDVLDGPAKGEEEFLKQLASVDADKGRGLVAAYRLASEYSDADPAAIAKAIAGLAGLSEDGGYSDDDLAEMAKSGEALLDGSLPIRVKEDIAKAIDAAADSPESREHVVKRAAALDASDLIPDDWNVSKEDRDMTDTATVPVKKEDGTWDLSAVPEDQQAFMKELLEKADRAEAAEAEKAELEKAASDAKKSEEDALAIAKEEREIRLTGVYVAKAEQLGESGEEFGPVLKTIAAAVDEATFEKLEAVLKANHERADAAGLYSEIGKAGNGGGESSAKAQLDAKAAEIRKSDTELSAEQALLKAYEQNPELYSQLRQEEN